MISLIQGLHGEITLPDDVRERYGLTPGGPLRMIETRHGILLVPLTGEPMSEELARELEEWQALGLDRWESFP